MLHGLLVLAAAEEPSKVPFYIAGGLLAGWAVVLGAIGLSRPEFHGGLTGERGVITISVVLVVATMSMAVVTA
jgi:hypothetical protein